MRAIGHQVPPSNRGRRIALTKTGTYRVLVLSCSKRGEGANPISPFSTGFYPHSEVQFSAQMPSHRPAPPRRGQVSRVDKVLRTDNLAQEPTPACLSRNIPEAISAE
jgi:hypothetical protein